MRRFVAIFFALTLCGCSAGKEVPDEPPMEPPAQKDERDNWVHADVGDACGEKLNIRCVEPAYCQATPGGGVCTLHERADVGEVCKGPAGTECKEDLACELDETRNDGSGVCVQKN